MKKMINRSVIILIACIGFVFTIDAQKGTLKLELGYNYSMPLGGFKSDIISDASPRGFDGALMYPINKKWSAGLYAGFQDYYQKYPRDVYSTGNHEVTSAVLSNSVQTTPLLFKGVFSPLGDNSRTLIKPYLSAAAGLNVVSFTQYLGEFGGTDNSVAFAAQAGAGVMVPFGRLSNSGLKIGANYDYVPYARFGYSGLNNLNVNAGVFFSLK